jgi:hypothetical protein
LKSCQLAGPALAENLIRAGQVGGMLVFVKDSAQAWLSSYVQAGDLLLVGDWRGEWTEWAGVGDALVRSL